MKTNEELFKEITKLEEASRANEKLVSDTWEQISGLVDAAKAVHDLDDLYSELLSCQLRFSNHASALAEEVHYRGEHQHSTLVSEFEQLKRSHRDRIDTIYDSIAKAFSRIKEIDQSNTAVLQRLEASTAGLVNRLEEELR